MGLYDLKEFLTFEDVADYLRDKGGYDFYHNNQLSYKKLQQTIKGLYHENKLNPVFYYNGLAKKNFEMDSSILHFRGYLYVNMDLFDNLYQNDYANLEIDDYLDIAKSNTGLTHIFMSTKRYKTNEYETEELDIFGLPMTNFETDYERYLKDLKGCLNNIKDNMSVYDKIDLSSIKEPEIIQENPQFLSFDDLLYPRIDFDNLFNQSLKNLPFESKEYLELQTENDRLKAENERLTAELNKKPTTPAKDELSPKTQQAVAKLLYALFKEHGYELGAKKGNTNDILQSLTQKHGVELSREFIATQLDKVNKLEKT